MTLGAAPSMGAAERQLRLPSGLQCLVPCSCHRMALFLAAHCGLQAARAYLELPEYCQLCRVATAWCCCRPVAHGSSAHPVCCSTCLGRLAACPVAMSQQAIRHLPRLVRISARGHLALCPCNPGDCDPWGCMDVETGIPAHDPPHMRQRSLAWECMDVGTVIPSLGTCWFVYNCLPGLA